MMTIVGFHWRMESYKKSLLLEVMCSAPGIRPRAGDHFETENG